MPWYFKPSFYPTHLTGYSSHSSKHQFNQKVMVLKETKRKINKVQPFSLSSMLTVKQYSMMVSVQLAYVPLWAVVAQEVERVD